MNIGKRIFCVWAIISIVLPLSIFAQDYLFAPPINYEAGDTPASVFCANLDGDGAKDIAVANSGSNNVSILRNNGNGTFQTAVNYNVGDNPISIFAVDLDGDWDNDLITANFGTDNVSILRNNGDGTFQIAVNYSVGSVPVGVFACDFDGDGDNDLAIANHISNHISILRNNGDGTFQVAVNYGVANRPLSIFVCDLDGDGNSDLAVANEGSGNVSILRNNGNGTFQAAVNYGVGANPRSIYACDLDGDGNNDLAVANEGSDNVSILRNNGSGTFQAAINYDAGGHPWSVYACDFDGDGDNDLALANYYSVNISVILNNSRGLYFSLIQPADMAIIINTPDQFLWHSPTYIDSGYPVYYRFFIDDNSSFTTPDSSGMFYDTTYTLPDSLARSKKYYWRAKAYNNHLSPLFCSPRSFYMDGYPTKPRIFALSNGSQADSSSFLAWILGTDPDAMDTVKYTLQVDDSSSFASPEINVSGITRTGLILDEAVTVTIGHLPGFSNLQDGQTYYWRVRSDDRYGLHSAWPDSLHWFVYLTQNHSPNRPVAGFSPANGEEVISLVPTIAWSDAIDLDPDDNAGTLSYIIELDTDSLFAGFLFLDTTAIGHNLIQIGDSLYDNTHYFYRLKTLDDGGLTSAWSPIQNFWTNHYNYPPEPFPLISPEPATRRVDYYTYFKWHNTIDNDPGSSFTFALQYSPDSLFRGYGQTIYGLIDTTIAVPTDSIAQYGNRIYWRVLAIDDDSLIRIGGIPEQFRKIIIVPVGDANGDGLLRGSDVTYLVSYFKGINPAPEPLLSGDVNGDCQLRGSDVTYLVRYFKGVGPDPVRAACEQPPVFILTKPKTE